MPQRFINRLFLWWQSQRDAGFWFCLLAPLSFVWGAVSFIRNGLYDCGFLKAIQVNRTVVSVGNIVVGGTGKTPLVHLLGQTFIHRRVAILSRGYGSMPDEPVLLQRRLPKARVYIGKNRVILAKQAIQDGAELLILDDGFQHRKLKRDFDLVILASTDPFGGGHFLPWGTLRDSPRRLEKADAIFVSGKKIALPVPSIVLQTHVDRILDAEERPISSIQGWKVGIFSGVAHPSSFKKTVVGLGAEVLSEWVLADHEPADPIRLEEYCKKCKSLGISVLICTEKDFVKIDWTASYSLPLFFLEISFCVVEGGGEWEKLIAKIDQKIDNIIS